MAQDEILAMRREKDQFFKLNPQSPLNEDQQGLFDGLRYYDHNPAFDLVVTVTPNPTEDYVTIETTTGDLRRYKRYGRFSFTVDGETAELTLYEAPHGYFLPFVDVNAGQETYPAGRYLEPEALGDDRFHVDFNRAYSPYCAYGAGWNCPITPKENRLTVAITAGEKSPVGEWLDHG